jgi:hypothetical protein
MPAAEQAGAPPPTRPPRANYLNTRRETPVITQGSYTAVSQENGTQVTQVEFDPENRGDPGRPRVFRRHGLWVCVAHFKSKEPESKRPRICLEEGRAATFGSVWADETKGRLALPGVKVASSSSQHGGSNSNPTRCSEGTSRAVDRKRPVPSQRLCNRGG